VSIYKGLAMAISLDEVRRRILIALFSDDELMNELVLKGGNALALVHKIGARASVDMDFSIQKAFADVEATRERIFRSLKREFGSIGYEVFDCKFEVRPHKKHPEQPEWWGGYAVEFKLIEHNVYQELLGNLEELRRRAEELGPAHKRKYTIDISQNEFCEGKVEREIDDYTIYVYSLEMIAIEKLRAICQQLPDYKFGNKSPRARDFYDIFEIITKERIDLTSRDNLELLSAIFASKEVSIDLLAQVSKHRDYHVLDWPSVEASISGPRKAFNEYFDFVVDLVSRVHAAWIKDTPVH
jgi:predicted nucleotidyltransferase component of viral defense system